MCGGEWSCRFGGDGFCVVLVRRLAKSACAGVLQRAVSDDVRERRLRLPCAATAGPDSTGRGHRRGVGGLAGWAAFNAGRFPGLFLVITGTPAFFDGQQGVRRLPPLAQRLATDFTTDLRFNSPRAVQLRLPGFDLPRLAELGPGGA